MSHQAKDPLLLNKVIAGLLTCVFVLLGGAHLINALYPHKGLTENAVKIDTSALEELSGQTASAPVGPDPIIALLASANIERGEKIFRVCTSCHTITSDGPNRVGPNLWNALGNKAASRSDFKYSKTMQSFADNGGAWDYESLNRYLYQPISFFDVGRGNMNFVGLKKTQDRADLILFLRSQADTLADLP